MGVWLLFVALVIGVAGLIVLSATRDRLESSSQDNLVQLAQLERERLLSEIDVQRVLIEQAASRPGIIRTLNSSFGAISAEAELTNAIETARTGGLRLTGLRLLNREGTLIGRTDGAEWEPLTIAMASMDERSVIVGQAVDPETLGFVAPVITSEGEVLGTLIVEAELDPIVRLAARYESFGETSEAFIYERLPDESCRLITNLRFDRSAAFSPVSGEYAENCNDLSTDRLFEGTDYRGVETVSAWTDVPGTEWGVVVKMDDSEVFALLNQIQRTVMLAGLSAVILLLSGWLGLVRPIGTRLFRLAGAAERLSDGNYRALINDPRTDEIGRVSVSLDSLAKDLAVDIERREIAEAKLRVRADFDDLTGLMNRHRTNVRMAELASGHGVFSVVFLDLDGFKHINDTHGHSVGDEVLRMVATRTDEIIKESGLRAEVGRWGGDEFVVLCQGALQVDLEDFMDLIQIGFEEPFDTSAGNQHVGVSVGSADSATSPSPEAMVSAADESMYRMKRLHDGRTRVSPESSTLAGDALKNNRVLAHMQPLISVDEDGNAHLFGAEALVRIQNEDGSIELPDSFLPGLGVGHQALALDLRVLEQAAKATAGWHEAGIVPPDFYLSVNFGAAALADPRLPEKILTILARAELAPEHLVVEVPETAKDVDPELIEQLRRRGIRIAIDDVGCQFSNLGRLVDIPADIAKIDRRWVPTVGSDEGTKMELLNVLVEQCRTLDLIVVVEGLETERQLELVSGLGVSRVQGFLFGRAIDPTSFEELWGREGADSLRVSRGNEDTFPVAQAA